jgi:hypothetical protein
MHCTGHSPLCAHAHAYAQGKITGRVDEDSENISAAICSVPDVEGAIDDPDEVSTREYASVCHAQLSNVLHSSLHLIDMICSAPVMGCVERLALLSPSYRHDLLCPCHGVCRTR